jgi:4-amino-4-deoxy-L-arabinose transferase-like glycosyltransferase
MPPRQLMIGLLVLTVLRWVVAGATELTPREALDWLGGRQSALGFFDHGPVAAWMVRVGTLVGGDTALGVRFLAPLAILAASVLAWRLAASAFGEKAAGWFLTALQLTPLVNVAAVRAWPETYAFLCAMAAAWWLWQAVHRASSWAWQWPAAGVALGLGVLSAPSGSVMVAGVLVLLSVPRRWRGRWRRPGPWLALACAAGAAWPWIEWLRGHEWLPARQAWFHWGRSFDLWALVRWLGLLLLAASPFLAAGMAWAGAQAVASAFRSWRRYREGGLSGDDPLDQKNGRVFLVSLAAPGVVWSVVEAVAGQPGLGVLAFSGCAALMLLAAAWVESSLLPATHRLAQNATLLVAAAYSLLGLHGDLARHLGLRWRYALDPGRTAIGWRETAAQTAAALRALGTGSEGARPVFLVAESPELAAILAFYLPRDLVPPPATVTRLRCHVPATLAVENDFSFWPGYADEPGWKGGDALFVAESAKPVALDALAHQFRQIDDFGRIEIRRGHWPVRPLSFFACRSWSGPAR